MRQSDDRGQATSLLLAAVGLTTVILLGLGPMGRALTDRVQARTAADAAALAGAAEGEAVARAMAQANGAELDSYTARGDEVVVKVTVAGVSAFGRARREEVAVGVAERSGLAPEMLAALAVADDLLGRPVPVASGFRSRAQQEALWERRSVNPYPVAPPGRSLHERGLAVDVPRDFVDDLLSVAEMAGLCQPLPTTDPVHFVVCGSDGRR